MPTWMAPAVALIFIGSFITSLIAAIVWHQIERVAGWVRGRR